ncbi:hypothetical protein N0V84_003864 [Fusarium piperis]|uniref:SprT-like domain-containing protein n=1 Tax=Fusarium piperis TaxID=1435070 RepID=A0A9W8WGV1_9HYPO|nr:hypothetical protein N0V84_003864 [Fusarium piperis]
MAFRVDDGGLSLGATGPDPYVVGGKRRVSHSDGCDGFTFGPKRKRFDDDYDCTNMDAFALPYDDAYNNPPVAKPSGHESPAYPYPLHLHHRHGYSRAHYGVHQHADYPYGRSYSSPAEDDVLHHDDIEITPPPIPPPDLMALNKLGFLVIRERSPPPEGYELPSIDAGLDFGSNPGPRPAPAASFGPAPVPGACAMERTESGLSVSSDTTQHSLASLALKAEDSGLSLLSDLAAARLVCDHVAGLGSNRRRHRRSDSRHGRILRTLIKPKSRSTDFPLDEDALRSIFSAANDLFFFNTLAGRVAWDWSHPASAQYQARIVGTTAVRRSPVSGFETLIVLSSPILKDTQYNRRLLISTFLHEMIHSYLFVTCGLKASHDGGHTEGFRQIADTIDDWVGRGSLRLSEMDADLEHFRERPYTAHEQHQVRSRSADDQRKVPWRCERWNDFSRDDYFQPHPRPHPDHSAWEWNEREGRRARDPRRGASPHVY